MGARDMINGAPQLTLTLIIDLARQTLYHCAHADEHVATRVYPVSTAKMGAGERAQSWRTPRGLHSIRAKIGEGAHEWAVFKRRRNTGEVCTSEYYGRATQRDWILTRILWLSGLEPYINRLGNVDTQRRFIYLHGTPPATDMSVRGSHGCIRMMPPDLITLFAAVRVGDKVLIVEDINAPWVWARRMDSGLDTMRPEWLPEEYRQTGCAKNTHGEPHGEHFALILMPPLREVGSGNPSPNNSEAVTINAALCVQSALGWAEIIVRPDGGHQHLSVTINPNIRYNWPQADGGAHGETERLSQLIRDKGACLIDHWRETEDKRRQENYPS